MESENILPETDPDLILAKSIKEALEMGIAFTKLDDSLINELVDFKNNELVDYERNAPNSSSIWATIEQEIRSSPKILPFYQRPIAYTWAAAAVLLIAAFIGVYWVSLNPSPQLVAQSDSTIQIIQLTDGTEVTLRPYSELYELTSNDIKRSYSLKGEAFFDVKSDASRPFSVEAGYGKITVLGTRFNVSNWGENTKVYLEEGSVQFSSNNQETVRIEPGQKSELISGSISLPTDAVAEEYTDWITNTIVLNSSLPKEAAAEIGQHFNIIVNIPITDNENLLDGTLRLDSINQTLEDLGLVLGGTFRKTSENEYTFISL